VAAFAAQQAAEKAVKAVYQRLGAEARGHSVTQLLSSLPPTARPAEALIEIAKDLDRHYITPRYPSQGAWVRSGKRVPVEPSVSASTGRDSDDR
jgi:HEPN domain-containing protein